jgi:hypothetical protein
MKTSLCIVALSLGLVLPLWLLASPPPRPASAPGPASRPAGIPIAIDERSGMLVIGIRPAPLLPELFLFDANRTSPAPPHIVGGDNVKVGGFTGKYPVPLGAGLSGPVAKQMWGVYADATLDASRIDRARMRALPMWRILGSGGETLASIAVSLAEESRFHISPQYVVYAQENRKIAENGPFATVIFPLGGSGVTLWRNSAKVEAGRSEESGAVSYRLEKVRRTDLLKWEIVGDQPAQGSICPILLGAEPGFVEYTIAILPSRPATAPAPK